MKDYFFPLHAGKITWGTKKKQKWNVSEYKSASGMRKSLVQQKYPAWVFEIEFPALDKREMDKLLAFYAQCKGSWRPFFYKDYEEYEVLGKTLVKGQDGLYQAVIPCGQYEEPAAHIDNVTMWVDGRRSKEFNVTGGKISTSMTGNITFDYEYYHKVIFANSITRTQKFYNIYKVSLALEVVR